MDRLVKSSQEIMDYTTMVLPFDAVMIVAETEDQSLVLTREYRHPTGQWILGCPGGRLEKEESPLIGAQRELFEETGFWSDELVLIGTAYPLPGLLNQKTHFVWAKSAIRKDHPHLEPFEWIELELKTENEVQKELQTGRPVDSLLCTALWYKSHHKC